MAGLIGGRRFWLWRVGDDEGEVLDLLVRWRRDARAAAKLMRRLLKNQGFAPRRLLPTSSALMGRPRRNSAYRLAMGKACGRTTAPRIRICRCDDASRRCSVSNARVSTTVLGCSRRRPGYIHFVFRTPRPQRGGIAELPGSDSGLNSSRALLAFVWQKTKFS
jgi:hypothetical protein